MLFDSDAFPCSFPLRILFFNKCLSIIKSCCCPKEQSRDVQPISLGVVRDISCLWHIFSFHSGDLIHLDTFFP